METLDELLEKIENQRTCYIQESKEEFSRVVEGYAKVVPKFNVGVETLGVMNYYLTLSIESFRNICLVRKNYVCSNQQVDESIIQIFEMFWGYNEQVMADMRKNFEKDFKNICHIKLRKEFLKCMN